MKNYIVRNCPACLEFTKLCESSSVSDKVSMCKDITDCLLKRIVEKCKEEWDLRPDMNTDDNFPKEILQLLEIEEVDE